jgi:DNA-repair protein XRCC1
MSLRDAKYRENGECTRFFKEEHLTKPAADEKWDRVKVICSQPYNNHTQYGLSFIIFHGVKDEEQTPGATPAPTSTELGRFKLKQDVPDPSLNPGSIFARRKEFAELDLKGKFIFPFYINFLYET